MDFSQETPPQRPGSGNDRHELRGADPHEHEPDEEFDDDLLDDGGIQGLTAMTYAVMGGVNHLWGEIDPRSNQPDRLRYHVGQCPELLAAFFSQASTFLAVLDEIVGQLENAEDKNISQEKQFWSESEIVKKTADAVTSAHDKVVAKVIEILAAAGVEVDEADVYSWDKEQRQTAMMWAQAEAQRNSLSHLWAQQNHLIRPDFLPKA